MIRRLVVCGLGLLLALAPPARPQALVDSTSVRSTLNGRVTDGAGQPIPDIQVRVPALSRSTVTDPDGRYAFPGLTPGTWQVTFQRLGYAPDVRRVALVPGVSRLDVTLRESLIEIPAIQVTATPNATTALTSPQPITVLSGAELRNALAPSLGETLEELPGLRNLSTGSGIGKPVIRGLSSNRVIVLSGGQRLENQQWGDEHGPNVESSEIERVEVIRGPASVLYGSDALGGAINLIRRDLPSAFDRAPFVRGRVSAGYGSNDDLREGSITLEGARRGLGFRGGWSGRGSDDTDTPAGELFNSGHRTGNGSGTVGYRGDWGSAELHYGHRNERIEIHEDPAEDPTATPFQRIEEDLGRLSLQFPLRGGARIRFDAGHEQNRRREFEAENVPEVALGLLSRHSGLDLQYHHADVMGVHGVAGATVGHTSFRKFGAETLIPESDGDQIALYVFEQTERGPWHLSFGLRTDHQILDVEADTALVVEEQTRDWSAVTGNAGVLYRIGEPLAVVLNLGRGFRAPSSFDLFSNGVHEGTVAFERGNPDLAVETSLNADLALRAQTSQVRGEIGAFVNQIGNFIHTRPTGEVDSGSGFEIFDVVQGDAVLVGGEASLEVHPTRMLHLHVTADAVRGRNRDTDQPLPRIPPFRVTYGAHLEGEAWGALRAPYVLLDAESSTRQDRLDPNDTTVEGATVLRAGAGFEVAFAGRTAALDLQVRNLLDEEYTDFLSRYKTYARAPGRSVILRVSAEF